MKLSCLVACVGVAGLMAVSACGHKSKKKPVPSAEQPKTEEEVKADEAAQGATKTLKEIDNRARQAAGLPSGTSLDDYNNTPSYELLVKKDPQVVKELVQIMDQNLVNLRAGIASTPEHTEFESSLLTTIDQARSEFREVLSSLDQIIEWDANMTGTDSPFVDDAGKQLSRAHAASNKALNAYAEYIASSREI